MGMTRAEAGRLGRAKADQGLRLYLARKIEKARFQAKTATCAFCLVSLPYEKRRNRFCSSSCSASYNNRGVRRHGEGSQEQLCQCGRKFTALGNRTRTWCSQSCNALARSNALQSLWLKGEYPGGSWRGVADFVRRWLVDNFGEKCVQCGWAEVNPKSGRIPLNVDHINGDPEDHRPGNLRFLCPNCHSLTSNFGALNRGKGRKQRYR